MFLANKLNKGGSLSSSDAQFNYVTMLLHGDGTNGAQNNTFVDSSTNNFTITRNGNTTQGSFSPYGSGWSNVFDGSISSAYLSVATNAAFNCGTGNFTVEAWVNITAYTGSYPLIIGNNNGGFSAGAIALTSQNATSGGASKISFTAYDINSSGVTLAAASTNTIGGWTHFAVVRNGTSLVLYINGASSASTTISAGVSLDFGKNGLLIGGGNWDTANGYYAGYISNLRLVKGTAVYTSAFTPSTTPLTAISGTSLLTCQSNRFIDNSSNAFVVTPTTSPSIQRFNPFGTATAYSTSVIGGSGYFDGSGDYLSGTNNSGSFGTGDFTIELWLYKNTTGTQRIIGGVNTGTEAFQLYIFSDNDLSFYDGATVLASLAVASLKSYAWNHIAVTRGSSTLRLYCNGVLLTSAANTRNIVSDTVRIGAGGAGISDTVNGYITDTRLLKGTALYTGSTYTVPTAPLTAITNTSLLTKFQNGAIFDNAMMNDLETAGNAQISTSVKKYGTGSMYFDGTGDYLDASSASNTYISGTEDFTVEGWLYLSNVTTNDTKVIIGGITNNSFGFRVGQAYQNNVQALGIYKSGISDNDYALFTFVANTWYHVAVTRQGSTIRFFVNGTQGTTQGTTVGAFSFAKSSTVRIGQGGGTEAYSGYIDDLRVTKGYARYTANFTAPTAALPDTGPI